MVDWVSLPILLHHDTSELLVLLSLIAFLLHLMIRHVFLMWLLMAAKMIRILSGGDGDVQKIIIEI